MSFLRRLMGGGRDPGDAPGAAANAVPGEAAADQPSTAGLDEAELARDRELLLEEARRLDDDLIQRQLRYADRAWTPPAQGGTRRADDEEGSETR